MSGNVCASLEQCSDGELAAALEAALSGTLSRRCSIVVLERRRSPYYSSRALEELDVRLDDGSRLAIIAKDVGPTGLIAKARNARPAFLRDPHREIAVYQDVLGRVPFGTPKCYGAAVDVRAGRYWLFLERIAGRELYRVGEVETWTEAARWLATWHRRFFGKRELVADAGPHLIVYDGDYFHRWMDRARQFVCRDDGSCARAVSWLSARYGAVVERLIEMPRTVIHGEFYASNVLAETTASGLRIAAIDWEMAGWGPPGIDLAALVSGDWSPEQVASFTEEYCSASASHGGPAFDSGSLREDLCCCRLHLAVQWLGWAQDWSPPSEHTRDWLAEALTNAEQLGL